MDRRSRASSVEGRRDKNRTDRRTQRRFASSSPELHRFGEKSLSASVDFTDDDSFALPPTQKIKRAGSTSGAPISRRGGPRRRSSDSALVAPVRQNRSSNGRGGARASRLERAEKEPALSEEGFLNRITMKSQDILDNTSRVAVNFFQRIGGRGERVRQRNEAEKRRLSLEPTPTPIAAPTPPRSFQGRYSGSSITEPIDEVSSSSNPQLIEPNGKKKLQVSVDGLDMIRSPLVGPSPRRERGSRRQRANRGRKNGSDDDEIPSRRQQRSMANNRRRTRNGSDDDDDVGNIVELKSASRQLHLGSDDDNISEKGGGGGGGGGGRRAVRKPKSVSQSGRSPPLPSDADDIYIAYADEPWKSKSNHKTEKDAKKQTMKNKIAATEEEEVIYGDMCNDIENSIVGISSTFDNGDDDDDDDDDDGSDKTVDVDDDDEEEVEDDDDDELGGDDDTKDASVSSSSVRKQSTVPPSPEGSARRLRTVSEDDMLGDHGDIVLAPSSGLAPPRGSPNSRPKQTHRQPHHQHQHQGEESRKQHQSQYHRNNRRGGVDEDETDSPSTPSPPRRATTALEELEASSKKHRNNDEDNDDDVEDDGEEEDDDIEDAEDDDDEPSSPLPQSALRASASSPSYESTIPKWIGNVDDDRANNSWSEPPANVFQVRGPRYLQDKKKIPSDSSMFRTVGLDVLLFDKPAVGRGRKKNSLPADAFKLLKDRPDSYLYKHIEANGKNAEFLFALNFIMPWGSFVCYLSPKSEGAQLNDPGSPLTGNEKMDKMISRICSGEEKYVRDRLKMVPHIVKANWGIKKMVGNKPAIIGKVMRSCTSTLCSKSEAKFLEVQLDSTMNRAARYLISSACNKGVVMDMGVLIQADSTPELPERILGCLRVHRLSGITQSESFMDGRGGSADDSEIEDSSRSISVSARGSSSKVTNGNYRRFGRRSGISSEDDDFDGEDDEEEEAGVGEFDI